MTGRELQVEIKELMNQAAGSNDPLEQSIIGMTIQTKEIGALIKNIIELQEKLQIAVEAIEKARDDSRICATNCEHLSNIKAFKGQVEWAFNDTANKLDKALAAVRGDG